MQVSYWLHIRFTQPLRSNGRRQGVFPHWGKVSTTGQLDSKLLIQVSRHQWGETATIYVCFAVNLRYTTFRDAAKLPRTRTRDTRLNGRRDSAMLTAASISFQTSSWSTKNGSNRVE